MLGCQLADFLFRVAGSLVSRPGEASTSVKGYGQRTEEERESQGEYVLARHAL